MVYRTHYFPLNWNKMYIRNGLHSTMLLRQKRRQPNKKYQAGKGDRKNKNRLHCNIYPDLCCRKIKPFRILAAPLSFCLVLIKRPLCLCKPEYNPPAY